MKKKYLILLSIAILSPHIAFAAWWNPLSWFNNWSFLDKKNDTEILERRIEELEAKLSESEIIISESISQNTDLATTSTTTESVQLIYVEPTPEETKPQVNEIIPITNQETQPIQTLPVAKTVPIIEIPQFNRDRAAEIDWAYWDKTSEDLDKVDTSWYKLQTNLRDKPKEYEDFRSQFTFFSPYVADTVAESLAKRGYDEFTALISITEKRLALLKNLTDSFKAFKRSVTERDPNVEAKYNEVLENIDEFEESTDEYLRLSEKAFDTFEEFSEALKDLGLL